MNSSNISTNFTINKIKPKPKYKSLKKFKDDFLFKFLYKHQKGSNRKILNWILYKNLSIFSEIIYNKKFNNIEAKKNKDFVFYRLKKKYFSKKLVIYFFYLTFFAKKKNFLRLKFFYNLLNSLLLKGFFLSLKNKISSQGFNFIFKNSEEFLIFFDYLKNLKFLEFNEIFLKKFLASFYDSKSFFLYKTVLFSVKRNPGFFFKKCKILKIWLKFLHFKFYDQVLDYDYKNNFSSVKSEYLFLRKKKKSRFIQFFFFRKKKKKIRYHCLFYKFWKLNIFLKKQNIKLSSSSFLSKRLRVLRKYLMVDFHNKDYKKEFIIKRFPILLNKIELFKLVNSFNRIKKYSYFLSKISNNPKFEEGISKNFISKIFRNYVKNLNYLKSQHNWHLNKIKSGLICYYGKLKKNFNPSISKNFLKAVFFLGDNFEKYNRFSKYKKRKFFINSFGSFSYFERYLKKRNGILLKFQYNKMNKIRNSIKFARTSYFFVNNRISPFKNKMLYLQKLTLFLGNLKKKQVKFYISKALKFKADSIKFFLISLESRIDVILFRLGFFRSFGDIRNFILKKNVFLVKNNKNKSILTSNFHLKNNDLFFINKKEEIFFKFLKEAIFRKIVLFQIPEYIEFNFFSFKGVFLTPLVSETSVFYPLSSSDFFNGTLENLRDILK